MVLIDDCNKSWKKEGCGCCQPVQHSVTRDSLSAFEERTGKKSVHEDTARNKSAGICIQYKLSKKIMDFDVQMRMQNMPDNLDVRQQSSLEERNGRQRDKSSALQPAMINEINI